MARRRSNVSQAVRVSGLRETMRACNTLGKEANKELRAAARDVAQATANEAKVRAAGVGALQRMAADSLSARSDRTPRIVGGGTKRVRKRGVPAGAVFFGAEFGGGGRKTTRQFPPHRGHTGYFLWPTVRERGPDDFDVYARALDDLVRKWGRGG